MELHKFQMAVYGQKQEDGGTCGKCERHRAVVWVDELQGWRCSSCLTGVEERRGRPKGRRTVVTNVDDQMWLKENFPDDYEEMFPPAAKDTE